MRWLGKDVRITWYNAKDLPLSHRALLFDLLFFAAKEYTTPRRNI